MWTTRKVPFILDNRWSWGSIQGTGIELRLCVRYKTCMLQEMEVNGVLLLFWWTFIRLLENLSAKISLRD